MIRTDSNGVVALYQHEVEVDANDPDLLMDELFDQLQKQGDAVFGIRSKLRWYFYPKSLPVKDVRTWDPKARRYT